jgi:hypothetical protein
MKKELREKIDAGVNIVVAKPLAWTVYGGVIALAGTFGRVSRGLRRLRSQLACWRERWIG